LPGGAPFESFGPMIEIVQPTAEGIARAADLLRSSQVVGVPTETVYGLAGNVFDEVALARIFEVKERPSFDPLIVHLADFEVQGLAPETGVVEAGRLDAEALETVRRLAESFWPGPLTLVLPRSRRVPDLATSGLDTVGVRVPAHPVARALLEAVGLPLAAPSANRFGRISPTRARDVADELGDRIPMVLDGGEAPVGIESTVVRVGAAGELELLRPGGVPTEALERVSGRRIRRAVAPTLPSAPGMLESHYAPGKRLLLLPRPLDRMTDAELAAWAGDAFPEGHMTGPVALLLQHGDGADVARAAARVSRVAPGGVAEARALASDPDPTAAARGLFATLRSLDATSASRVLVAEPADGETGLRHAINDRLRRAAAPRASGR
jgi:L-threonylcarbamoyladenylate synthase